jgi:hypothetical protein
MNGSLQLFEYPGFACPVRNADARANTESKLTSDPSCLEIRQRLFARC